MDRKFLHLSEIEKCFSLTKEQVLDEVEVGKLNLHAWVSTDKAFAISESNAVLAQVCLSGHIRLSNEMSKKLLVGDVQLRKLTGFTLTQLTNPIAAKEVFSHHGAGEFSNICGEPIDLAQTKWIALSINNTVPFLSAAMSAQGTIEGSSNLNALDSIANALSAFSSTVRNGEKQLSLGYFALKPSDIRLHVGELRRHFNLTEAEIVTPSKPVIDTPLSQCEPTLKANTLTHEIAIIQFRILEKHPKANSKTVWNIIREDVRKEEFMFDRDEVILDMGTQNMTYGNNKEMGYRTFQNMLSDVRKYVHN
ncbi:hypothetical protein [Vibrio ulleungensis]|uniref:Uncharacterized protein n=1 Tax=Vibrio ulleungensis TaxID=2807619 RepID=A0ABS2HMY4_9VIBR|nr:hypothetical protein [Vibrio ulleungensis]MBM7037424.1 hypothetical protein [Vibrio ulleungensis]